MGAYVPVYGFQHRLTANYACHAVTQQFPSLTWSDLGVYHGGDSLDSPLTLSEQGVQSMGT
eukprot:2543234-Alexandrium_andersonii.AAC.1